MQRWSMSLLAMVVVILVISPAFALAKEDYVV